MRSIRTVLACHLVLVGGLVLAGCAAAPRPTAKAAGAADARDARALQRDLKECDQGIAKSCGHAGWMLSTGSGVPKDEARALPLFERACDGKVAAGCDNAGRIYRDKGDPRGAALEERGCALGDGESCGGLAGILMMGIGVPRDLARAFAVAIKACDLGHAMSCRNAGSIIMAGPDANKDFPRMAALFDKACRGGDMPGCANRGAMLFEGIGVERDEKGGVALVMRACDGGELQACGYLGFRYRDGQGVPRDAARAVALLERACNATLPANEKVLVEGRLFADACRAAELLYREGAEGVAANPTHADELNRKACARGYWCSPQ